MAKNVSNLISNKEILLEQLVSSDGATILDTDFKYFEWEKGFLFKLPSQPQWTHKIIEQLKETIWVR